MTTEWRVDVWPIDRFRPYARNPRKNDHVVSQMEASIREFGFKIPMLARSDGEVVDGHLRLKAAANLGLRELPTILCDEWTPAQVKAFRILVNKSVEWADWDADALNLELVELKDLDFDLRLTGFELREIEGLSTGSWQPPERESQKPQPPQAEPCPPADDAADDTEDPTPAAEPQQAPVTRPGDVWQIGKHRLICGDCRDYGVIDRLFAGAQANVAITSPPYAKQREYDPTSGFKPIPPDQYSDWFRDVAANLQAILAADGSYFLNIKEHSEEGERSLYVKDLVLAHKREWGWRFVDEFCWRNTANGVPGKWPNRLKNAWEPVFHFARNKEIKFRPTGAGHQSEDCVVYSPDNPSAPSGSGLLGCGAEKTTGIAWPSNVIEAKAEGSQGSHSAPFPRALVEFFLKAFTDAGDIAFDPFTGSGTTIAAAATLDRIGYGCEISPAYCDGIVRRLMKLTGEMATLADTGETFEAAAESRGGRQ